MNTFTNPNVKLYIERKRERYPQLDEICFRIIGARQTPSDGITIDEIRAAYMDETSERFPLIHGITQFLLTIPKVRVYSDANGTRHFYTNA